MLKKLKKIKRLKNHLLKGKSITGLQALSLWGYYRLGDGIFRLRKQGLNIVTEKMQGDGFTYAKYYLNK